MDVKIWVISIVSFASPGPMYRGRFGSIPFQGWRLSSFVGIGPGSHLVTYFVLMDLYSEIIQHVFRFLLNL